MGALPVQRCSARNSRTLSVLAILLAFWGASSAAAAIPDAEVVTTKARGTLLRSTAVRLTYVDVRPAGSSALAMRLVMVPGTGLRVERVILSGGVETTPRAQVWRRGEVRPAGADALDEAPAWLQLLVGEDVDVVLKRVGADRSRVSLAHADGTILWVVGAGPRALDLPQLHVVRATGRLWRVIERRTVGEVVTTVDVTLEGAAPPAPGDETWWPSVVTIKDHQGLHRFELSVIERGLEGAPETLLAPRALAGEGSSE